jgi:hypothetical protein
VSASRAIAAVPISDNHDPLLSASAGFRDAISARLTGELSGSISDSRRCAEAAHVGTGDRFCRLVENDALDRVADVAAIEDVGRNGRHKPKAQPRCAASPRRTAADCCHQGHACRAPRYILGQHAASLPRSAADGRDETADSGRETKPSASADRTPDVAEQLPVRPNIGECPRR